MRAGLQNLGLTRFFLQQLTEAEAASGGLARVIEVQRSHVIASDGESEWTLSIGGTWYQLEPESRPTVGDWIVLDEGREQILRLLDRKSVFRRVAAGERVEIQLIAANVDTLFIVTSCNEEFNESRLERYLVLAMEAGVDPVIILTKADLTDDAEKFRARVKAVQADLPVDIVNAKDSETLGRLSSWVTSGSTVALVGSSGVGKSTIVNSLANARRTETGEIREQDSKGRHTTSYRSLHRLPGGGILLDVPGMREIKIANIESSLSSLFEDVEALAYQCKFGNCTHRHEPDCAVRNAISSGTLDQRRLDNYQKLVQEDQRNTASLADQRDRDRKFTRSIRQHTAFKRNAGKKKSKKRK